MEVKSIFTTVGKLSAAVVAALMIVSATHHLRNSYYFFASVLSYNSSNVASSQVVAMFLPSLQLVVGGFIFANVFVSSALAISAILFSTYTMLQLHAMIAGMEIKCGCFGAAYDHDYISVRSIALPLSGLIACAIALATENRRSRDLSV